MANEASSSSSSSSMRIHFWTLIGFRILALQLLLIPQDATAIAAKVIEPLQEVKDETENNFRRRTRRRQSAATSLQDSSVTSPMVHFDTMDDEDVKQQIVGGEEANEGQYPYFVDVGGCGGSLIAPDLVLTAGHCGNFTGETAVAGAYYNDDNSTEGSKLVQIVGWERHPGYNSESLTNDMALLKIDPPVYQSTSITLVLPEVDDIVDSESLTIIGLGTLEHDAEDDGVSTLRDVDVLAMPINICNGTGLYNGLVDDTMFCAGYFTGEKDACVGDSGGPLVRKIGNEHVQVGVVSWGNGCGLPLRPGVYARIHKKIRWIKDVGCTQWGSPSAFCDGWTSNSTTSPTPLPIPDATSPPTPDDPSPPPTPGATPDLTQTSRPTPVPTPPLTPGPTPAGTEANSTNSQRVDDSGAARSRITLISFAAICVAPFLLF